MTAADWVGVIVCALAIAGVAGGLVAGLRMK